MLTEILPNLEAGYQIRPCTLDDVEPVVALMNACALKVIGKADEAVEEILTDWQKPGVNQSDNQRVVISPEGHFIGWAEVSDSQAVVLYIDIYVHPDHENSGVGAYLTAWCEQRARECITNAPAEARIAMRGYTYEQDTWYRGLLERAGMQVIRHFWHMEIKLTEAPPAPYWPDGIRLQIFTDTHDRKAVLEAERAAFQDQFGYVERPFDEHYQEWSHYWDANYEPGLWLLALDGDQIAGIALCKPSHAGEEDRGWVSALGVRRQYRRRGIAQALLYAAFEVFYQRGKQRVGLGVDASSLTGATELYRRAGMQVVTHYCLYEKELRAGVDMTTR